MEIPLLRSLVWLDFRLAVVFTVFAPLLLLIWAYRVKNSAILRSLTIYWRVSCLLAITAYLLMASLPIGFLTGWIARILMPVSLWFWQDLNEDIDRSKGKLPLIYTSWRWAMAVYCAIGTIFGVTFLNCGFSAAEQLGDQCKVLMEAPLQFKSIFHNGVNVDTLAFGAIVALIVYAICFASFVIFNLPKQGRIAFRE